MLCFLYSVLVLFIYEYRIAGSNCHVGLLFFLHVILSSACRVSSRVTVRPYKGAKLKILPDHGWSSGLQDEKIGLHLLVTLICS